MLERPALLPMALAVIALSFLSRRLIGCGSRHPLAANPSKPGRAALGSAIAFLTLFSLEGLWGAGGASFVLAWALPSILLIYLTRAIIHDLGWALTDGGIAVLAPAASSHASPAALGADLRCPVVCCLAFDDPQGLQRLRQLVDGGHVEAVVLMGIPPDRRDAVLDRVAELPVGIFLSTQPSTAHAMVHDVVEILPNLLTGRTGLAKRALDVAGASLGLLLFAPLILLAALLIRLESPGPAFFRQSRFGCGGGTITIWKLRSMYVDRGDVSGARRTLVRDPRVTPLGRILRRLSIDELPQLLNVLRGEMSLVGPRPHAVRMQVEGRCYRDAVESYPIRHRMKPGITGWAQVNGSRGEVDTLEKARRRVALDLWYISNWSILLDLIIIQRTILGRFATLDAD
ncbi:exopolysaccharide biosynthesis polyprenyl glycosylphosphotransferase [Roseicella sp. DB1501]|uniref:exopolysaccharide biosynthesis polyprenyl glycosylphosphotransferase n=1 Tax=Roseicella sp. DB1501 TaxID=2730925 RepID=UPI0014917BC0|nr:exopolysaccharide biosynthesis polyprenyl glycosylphosphotransferase [Roseicella sp. DB1501]